MNIDLVTPSGGSTVIKGSASGALFSLDRHGTYYEAVRNGNFYHASMQAGASLGTALTATAVTLTLYNPSGSPVNLVLMGAGVAITTYLAAAGNAHYVLAANVDQAAAIPTGLTAGTVRNNLLGASAGYGKAYTAATLPAAPVIVRAIGNVHLVGATPVSESSYSFWDKTDGALILKPNTALTVQGVGTASSGIVSMYWEEVPI
jgi:hypothetical protein